MQFLLGSSLLKMDDYLIKHLEQSPHLIPSYFFLLIDQLTYEKKMSYFISRSLVGQSYQAGYYYLLPFKILNVFYQSLMNSSSKVKLTNSIYLPREIWSHTYFNEQTIYLLQQKKKMLSEMNCHFNQLFNAYLLEQKFGTKSIEEFTRAFNERRIMKLLYQSDDDFLYLNSLSDYLIGGSGKEEESYEQCEDYIKLLEEFMKNSLQLYQLLALSDKNEEYCDNVPYDKNNYNWMMYIKKVEISRLYSRVILRMMIGDVMNAIKTYLRERKLQVLLYDAYDFI